MANSRTPNPFKPTAGMNPPELIGRDAVLGDFSEALDNGPGAPERLMRISGVRGVGKTVLLNALGRIAEAKGFTVVDVASNPGFCSRIRDALVRHRKVSSAEFAPSVLGVSLGSVSVSRPATALGEAMLEASGHGGLFVTLDEIQDAPADEMRELGNEIQLLIRQEANVAFAFAGLPAAVDEVVGERTLTFLQRARHVELARLADFEVGDSMEDTIRRSGKSARSEVISRLIEAARGYPFMVQLVGYYSWQAASCRGSDAIEVEDAERGVANARASFDDMVIAPALRRLPERQRAYLRAMASCASVPASSGEVATLMGAATKDVSSYRARLMREGLVTKAGYGKVDFAVPYMREYLRERLDDEE